MKKLLYVFLGLVVLIVAAVVAVPLFISADTITNQLVATVKEKTGRDLSFGAAPKLSVFPNIALEAQNVALSNPGGQATGSLVSMGELKVDLALMPLLSGQVDIKQFVLVKPVLALQVDGQGVANWQFDQGAASDGGSTSTGGDSGSPVSVSDIRLGKIEVVEGVISYEDARTGEKNTVSDINVALALPDLTSPFDAKGSAVWNGEKMDLTIKLGSLKALMDGQSTNLETAVTSKHLTMGFNGTIASTGGFGMTGAIDAKSPSVRELAAWTGNTLTPGNGLGAFSVGAKMNMVEDTLTLSDAKLQLDGMNAQGSAVVALGGARPSVRGNLGVDRIDVNQYLGGKGQGGGQGSGGSAASGWSDAKFDFTGLSAIDANLKLAASQILYRDLKIGKSALDVTIVDGKLTAKLTELALYSGQAKGTVVLDGSKQVPALQAAFNVAGVDGRSLLADAMKMKWLEGKGKLSVSVAAAGTSQRQMVSSLGGKASFLFSDGAIRGVNIPGMLRSLGQNPLSGWGTSQAQKTDFSSFSASYSISKGIATNRDLKLLGPLVRVTGGGTINMPKQSLGYRVKPKLVGSLQGQGGLLDISGLGIDVIISGPWSNPQIYPDIKGILDNPEAAYNAIKGVGKVIESGKPKDILKGIIKAPGEAVEDGGEKVKDPIGGVLKKLF